MTMVFRSRLGLLVGLALWWLLPSCVQAAEVVLPAKVVGLPRSGQISTFDQAGKLIDFKGSGQDGEFQRGAVWPEPRFIINDDGTLSDALTGLMWLKDGNCFGELPWPTALQMVASFNQGNAPCHELKTEHHDWFLPDVNQLASLLDAEAEAPTDYLRLVGLIGVQNGVYWSSTPYLNRLNAWGVDFQKGSIEPRLKLDRHFLLLARRESPEKKVDAQAKTTTSGPGGEGTRAPSGGASQRFLDNGDGTVTDVETGLMWLQDGSCLAALDWQGALAAMKRLNGGKAGPACKSLVKQYADWSLPNAIELRSLIDYGADYPALSAGHSLTALAQGYWTATTVAAAAAQAFVVDLDTGALRAEPKTSIHQALAVRQVAASPDRPRKLSEKGGSLGVAAEYLLALDPELSSEIRWPPAPRFYDNGDGTSLDTVTGVNWLTDANCFGKRSWQEVAETLLKFNLNPEQFKCADYEGGNKDWQLPTLAEMRELVNADAKDPLDWLNQQGLKNVQGSSIYWTATETPLNLYYADGIVLKSGKAGNYPKSLKFSVWPMRREQQGEVENEPLLNITANALDNLVTLSPDDPLSLVVFLHSFGLRMPCDFWFWYDTPAEKSLWLTSIRTWTDKATPVYQGKLFNLKNYEIYRSTANDLAPGVYDFHFAVDTAPNGVFDAPRYEIKISVVIAGSQE